MPKLLNFTTVIIILSAFGLAILCILPGTSNSFPLWIIASGASVADTMFHELGHSITGWLLGVPNVPSILTIFGRGQAAGLTWHFGHFWLLQGIVIAGFAYLSYDLYHAASRWFLVSVVMTALVIIIGFSGYYQAAISYMGHGGAILMGAFFLFRSWLGLAARNLYERWLNAFLGFFPVLNNIHFAYTLAYDADFNEQYSDHVIGGVTHNDLVKLAGEVAGWTVHGIAVFTIIFGAAMLLLSFFASIYVFKFVDIEAD